MLDTAVIIPSYNSAPWIVKLVHQILKQKRIAKIIIVDDSSPDGTSQIVRKKLKSKKVFLIERGGKDGRGGAVLGGFEQALKDRKIRYLIEMDSDFAHKPSDIPRLISAMDKYDVAIGSRYFKGGKTVNYGMGRKIFSRIANIWAYIVLSIRISDYTSGYRCYRREAIEKANLKSFKTKGFITLSELAYKISRKGFKIGEIPISVSYHPRYKSNLNIREIFDAFIGVLKIRFSS